VSEIQMFKFESTYLRTVQMRDETWFVAKDVCDILQHTNHRMALAGLDEDEKGVSDVYTLGGTQSMTVVNEAGLYSLIFTSRLPKAKDFKRWITHEVLPSIRKTGTYSVQQPKSVEDLIIMQAQSVKELRQQVQEVNIELQVHKHRIDSLDRIDVDGDGQQRLNKMIRKYAHQEGLTFQKAWRDFTDRFNTAYHTNLTARVDNYRDKHGLRELSRPQYLSIVGQLDDAIRVGDKMLNQSPVGV